MGPRSFNRGNRCSSRLSLCPLLSFNGAAVFQPRKFVTLLNGILSELQLQWGRGLSTAEIGPALSPAEHATPGFNGAAVFQPRKSGAGRVPSSGVEGLQWGRGLSTAEIGLDLGDLEPAFVASMGPRSFNRGNARSGKTSKPGSSASMGPRSFNRGNGGAPGIPGRAGNGFNGAAVFQPRK